MILKTQNATRILVNCGRIGGKIAANGLALGEEADFEALNCQPSKKIDAS
jgi:hypothetical protein